MFHSDFSISDKATFYHEDRKHITQLKKQVKTLTSKIEIIEKYLNVHFENGLRIVKNVEENNE